jgi:hypothetical protein
MTNQSVLRPLNGLSGDCHGIHGRHPILVKTPSPKKYLHNCLEGRGKRVIFASEINSNIKNNKP